MANDAMKFARHAKTLRRNSRPDSNDIVEWARTHLNFEPDEVQARVLRSESKRGILLCTRQWGKSTVTAAMALHHALFTPRSLTLVVAPCERQSGEFVRKARTFALELGLKPRGDGNNDHSLSFPNHSRIVGVPAKEDTVRGYSRVGLMLIDEAARVPDELYKAVRPMLAVGKGRLWLMSTPHGKRGFFHDEWHNGGELWERVSVTALECPRIPKEFLEEERRTQGRMWFEQEYLCKFTQVREALFDMEMVGRLVRQDIKPLVFR